MPGFEDMNRKLNQFHDQFIQRAEAASGDVPLTELIPDSFVSQHSRFHTLQEMTDASGIQSAEEVGTPLWNDFIAANTDFEGWDALLQKATEEYFQRKLAF